MIYPENFEIKIGFDKIRTIISENCISSLGKEYVNNIRFSVDKEFIAVSTGQVNEFVAVLKGKKEFPVSNYYDLTKELIHAKIPGAYIDQVSLFNLKRSLDTMNAVYRFLKNLDGSEYPYLVNLTNDVVIHSFVTDKIDNVLDRTGGVRDGASPELKKIRQEMRIKQASLSGRMDSILKQAKSEGIVDNDVTLAMRDGRLVIPVQAANKRKIKGFIHDESATGKTAFIEPAEIFEINNEIVEFIYAEQREIIKILKDVADYIRPYIDDILDSFGFLGLIDFIRAKSIFAISIGGIRPNLSEKPEINWQRSFHPLLLLSHRKEKKEVVPLTISINESDRILLISGPNAGGKSVCLKTTGLLQYMLQCGLLIPMEESSVSGIFHDIFIDIGDEQSIENDLSTYSSHLLNMKYFVKNASGNSLLLIDEFGAGTEPLLGGAIAEAILGDLNMKKSRAVITTHYTNLKHYASSVDGIVNGAMLYDQNKLEPLFILEAGKPGSSFAFEIARKIGLPESVLQEAIQKVGKKQVSVDKMLKDLSRDKRYWENKRKKIRQEEKRVDELLENLKEETKTSGKAGKQIIREAKEEAKTILDKANKVIENTIKSIRESQAEKEKTAQAREEIVKFKESFQKEGSETEKKVDKKMEELNIAEKKANKLFPKMLSEPELAARIKKDQESEIRIGDFVRLKEMETSGEIIEISNKDYIIAIGNIITTIGKERVEKISRNEFRAYTKGKGYTKSGLGWNLHEKRLNFKSSIDIRGKRVEEAMPVIYQFIDDAITLNVNEVKILHGTGTGVLRQYIREYLNTVQLIKSYGDEHIEMGGSGITVVRF